MPINIHIRQLEAFLAVAKTHGFTEAAAQLYLTQPTLSSQIQRLEQTLGLPLFLRSTRKVELTDAGRDFYPIAEQVVCRLTKGMKELQAMAEGKQGRITFAALLTVGASLIPAAMNAFSQRYPDVTVEYLEENDEPIYQRVLNGDIDFGIGVAPVNQDEVIFTPVYKDYLFFVCSKTHPLAELTEIGWEQIVEWPFIAMKQGNSLRKLTEQGYAMTERELRPVQEASYQTTILGMVANNIGVSVLPSSLKFMFEHPGVQLITIKEQLHRNIGIMTRKNETLMPAARRFIAVLLELVESNRSLLPPI